MQDCGTSAEAFHHSSCSTGCSQWRDGSSTSSGGEHSGEPATRPRAAARNPAIFSSSLEEVGQQRQRIAWPTGPEGAKCDCQQAFPSAGFTSSSTSASPSRTGWCECWPGSGVGAPQTAAGRSVSIRQLLHVLYAKREGQATCRSVHRLRRSACRGRQDQGRHQDQDEALLHKAEGHRGVTPKLDVHDCQHSQGVLDPHSCRLLLKACGVCALCDQSPASSRRWFCHCSSLMI